MKFSLEIRRINNKRYFVLPSNLVKDYNYACFRGRKIIFGKKRMFNSCKVSMSLVPECACVSAGALPVYGYYLYNKSSFFIEVELKNNEIFLDNKLSFVSAGAKETHLKRHFYGFVK